MATHSRILAWRIPRTEQAGKLQYISLQSWTWTGPKQLSAHKYIQGDLCSAHQKEEVLSQSLLASVSDPRWVLDIQKLGCTHSMLNERHLS